MKKPKEFQLEAGFRVETSSLGDSWDSDGDEHVRVPALRAEGALVCAV